MVVAVAAVGVAPPTPLQPRVYDPPTSTPGPTPFRCGQVPGGGRHLVASLGSVGYAGRRCCLWSSTVGQASLHATTHAPAHASWLVAGSSTIDSGGVVPMDGGSASRPLIDFGD
jgi:hypothetical protein